MKHRASNGLQVLFLLLLAVCLGACSGLTRSDKPAETTWWLAPYTGMASADEAGKPEIRLLKLNVTAIPGLDHDRILGLTSDAELKPYAGARWADHIPELTASLVSRSLASSGRFTLSRQAGQGGAGRCDMNLEVREFFSEVDAAGRTSRVSIAVDGYYQCDSGDGKPISIRVVKTVDDGHMKSVVAAFQSAFDELMIRMLKQV